MPNSVAGRTRSHSAVPAGSLNCLKALVPQIPDTDRSVTSAHLRHVVDASSTSVDNLLTALQQMDQGLAGRERDLRQDFTVQVNQAIQAISDRVDADLSSVRVFDGFQAVKGEKTTLTLFSCEGEVDWPSWKRRFEDLVGMSTNQVNEAQKCRLLIGNLTGRARDAVEELPAANQVVYADLIETIEGLVCTNDSRALARQKLSSCKQETHESIDNFAARLTRIVKTALAGKTADVVSERLLEHFTDNLRQPIRFHVKTSVPESFAAAVSRAKTMEALLADAVSSATLFPNSSALIAVQAVPSGLPHIEIRLNGLIGKALLNTGSSIRGAANGAVLRSNRRNLLQLLVVAGVHFSDFEIYHDEI